MTDDKNGLEPAEKSAEPSVGEAKIPDGELTVTPADGIGENNAIEGPEATSFSEERTSSSEESYDSAPSLDLLLYDSDDEVQDKKYGSAADYGSILDDYKDTIARALAASSKGEETPVEEEEEAAPTLVKHKEAEPAVREPAEASEEEEPAEDETLIPELFSSDTEERADGAQADDGAFEEEAQASDEGGEQLELELGIPEGTPTDGEEGEEISDGQSVTEKAEPDEPKPRKIDSFFDVVELFLFTLVAVMLLTNFVFRHSKVEGGSMMETLHDGDHLIISDLFYTPDYGDIVVFTSEATDKPLIKRVVALEGDKVDFYFADGKYLLYVNDELIEEDYAYIGGNGQVISNVEDHIVGKGKVFVLGDHRNNSTDSRDPSIGDVDADRILGRVIFRFYPFTEDRFGPVE